MAAAQTKTRAGRKPPPVGTVTAKAPRRPAKPRKLRFVTGITCSPDLPMSASPQWDPMARLRALEKASKNPPRSVPELAALLQDLETLNRPDATRAPWSTPKQEDAAGDRICVVQDRLLTALVGAEPVSDGEAVLRLRWAETVLGDTFRPHGYPHSQLLWRLLLTAHDDVAGRLCRGASATNSTVFPVEWPGPVTMDWPAFLGSLPRRTDLASILDGLRQCEAHGADYGCSTTGQQVNDAEDVLLPRLTAYRPRNAAELADKLEMFQARAMSVEVAGGYVPKMESELLDAVLRDLRGGTVGLPPATDQDADAELRQLCTEAEAARVALEISTDDPVTAALSEPYADLVGQVVERSFTSLATTQASAGVLLDYMAMVRGPAPHDDFVDDATYTFLRNLAGRDPRVGTVSAIHQTVRRVDGKRILGPPVVVPPPSYPGLLAQLIQRDLTVIPAYSNETDGDRQFRLCQERFSITEMASWAPASNAREAFYAFAKAFELAEQLNGELFEESERGLARRRLERLFFSGFMGMQAALGRGPDEDVDHTFLAKNPFTGRWLSEGAGA